MSSNGQFMEEDSDIVELRADTCEYERTGWVNIGVHSVKLWLSADGHLVIQSFPRSNETAALAEMLINKETAAAAGGVDPDE